MIICILHYMLVHVIVCIHTRIHINKHSSHTCMHARTHSHAQKIKQIMCECMQSSCGHTRMYSFMQLCTHTIMYSYMHINDHIDIHTHVHLLTRTIQHIHSFIRTYTHIYTHRETETTVKEASADKKAIQKKKNKPAKLLKDVRAASEEPKPSLGTCTSAHLEAQSAVATAAKHTSKSVQVSVCV